MRRDAMNEALTKYAPSDLIWNKPRGGYYIWCKLPVGVSAAKLVKKAAEHKVTFVQGSPFLTSGQGDDYIKLNFTFVLFVDIEKGIKRLCTAIKELMRNKECDDIYSDVEINPIV